MKEMIFGFTGGLALFIYGMSLMGEGLKKVAGEKMRRVLEAVTKNPLSAVAVGTLVTAIIQSSGATTVMVIGFVNSRLMTLTQAIGVIMGANIGTTITAQLIAFNIGNYAYPIAAIGFALLFAGKKRQSKYLGQVIFGFGVLFIGLNTMTEVFKPLAKDATCLRLVAEMSKSKFWGITIGTVLTAIMQSSSVVIGVLQSLASQAVVKDGVVTALISLPAAVPVLFGSNIGTTFMAIIASIGSNINAKRSALSHTLFNVFGTILGLILLPLFLSVVLKISPHPNPGMGITEANVVSRQIANAHTLFNVINALVWLPFVSILAKMVVKLFPGEDVYLERGVKYIDPHLTTNAEVALDLSLKELVRMGGISSQFFKKIQTMIVPNVENQGVLEKEMNEVNEMEEILDELQEQIIHYLSTIVSQNTLTIRQSVMMADLMHVTGDIERIGDHCLNLAELAVYKENEGVVFSQQAYQDIERVVVITTEMLNLSLNALERNDFFAAKNVLELEKEMDSVEKASRMGHLERLSVGTCNPKSAVIFSELIKNLERIADHCNNIAEAVLDQEPYYRR